jgi:hypothetical protein
MKSQSNSRRDAAMFLVALLTLLFIAGDHPLVEHWGDVAMSSNEEWGSKWIHTDTGGVRYGLYGESASSEARGVYGSATYTGSSGLAIGVVGESDAQTGRGVHGYGSNALGVNYGVTGETYSTDATAAGVFGYIARTTGSARGVQGRVLSTNGLGVFGIHNSTGSGNGAGVYGYNSAPSGVGYGIYGYNSSADGWSGNFTSVSNGVVIQSAAGSTGLVVNGGSKSASVPTSDGDRLLYNEESTEVWFSDYGNAQLEGGFTVVIIDPVFAETVNLRETYHVFLQSYGDANLYVDKQTGTSFEVRSVSGSVDKNAAFSYRIVARRLGFEDARLELAPWVTEEQKFLEFPQPPEEPTLIDVVGE